MKINTLAIILDNHGLYFTVNTKNIDITDNKGNVYDTLTPDSNYNVISKEEGCSTISEWLGY